MTHPEATIRLGIESGSHKAFDLELPGSLARHVTVLGKTGSGKTTTALRLIQGALRAGYPVVVVDAKGLGSLRRTVETLAAGLPFQLVAPGDAKSLRYNPCNGTPAQISNKLVGAFDYGPEAQIYKNIVQETLPIVARGLIASGEPVNLASLSSALDQARMKGLATRMGDKDPEARQLLADFSNRGNLYSSAFAGMRARLGALRHGEFGPIFAPEGESPVLDLAAAFTTCGVTYVSLPTMASSEDVQLMTTVLIQDIKQVAATRIANAVTAPALLVLDEFAAVQGAEQINDLLLQAREAQIPTVVCTQFLPTANEAPLLRAALLGAGVFIAHQVGPEDAEPVAQLFGTETRLDWTQQIDNETGDSQKGTVRPVHEYRVHPDTLRNLRRGKVALREFFDDLRIASVDVALPTPADSAGQTLSQPVGPLAADAARTNQGAVHELRPASFLTSLGRAINGDGLLIWAAALLIGWEGFFQWALAGLYGAFTATLFLEYQLGAHSYLGLSGGGAILAVIVTAVLAVTGGGLAGIAAFPFFAVVWMVQNLQATLLWAGFGFSIAVAITYWTYLTERSVGIRGYRQLTTAERDFVVPIYHDVASELEVSDLPRLVIADAPMPGAGSHLATISLTTGLLTRPQPEIAAVLAHELGHHLNGHALRLRFAWACALPIVLLYSIGLTLTQRDPQSNKAQLPRTPLGIDPMQVPLQLVGAGVSSARGVPALLPRVIGDISYFIAWPAMHLMLLPFMAAASRRMELEADAVVTRIGGAEHLAKHLRLSEFVDWTHGGWEAFGLKTHPPVAERIDHLNGKPRRSLLDPLTHALDRVSPFGLSVRELLIWGVFIPSVLVTAGYWLFNLWRVQS